MSSIESTIKRFAGRFRFGTPFSRGGFAIYLTILVTMVLFYSTFGGHDIAKASLDLSRSILLDITAMHAADGGLERGLAKLRKAFFPFEFSFSSTLGLHRKVVVHVVSKKTGKYFDLFSHASVFEGEKKVAFKKLVRYGVSRDVGRRGAGRFAEEP